MTGTGVARATTVCSTAYSCVDGEKRVLLYYYVL